MSKESGGFEESIAGYTVTPSVPRRKEFFESKVTQQKYFIHSVHSNKVANKGFAATPAHRSTSLSSSHLIKNYVKVLKYLKVLSIKSNILIINVLNY